MTNQKRFMIEGHPEHPWRGNSSRLREQSGFLFPLLRESVNSWSTVEPVENKSLSDRRDSSLRPRTSLNLVANFVHSKPKVYLGWRASVSAASSGLRVAGWKFRTGVRRCIRRDCRSTETVIRIIPDTVPSLRARRGSRTSLPQASASHVLCIRSVSLPVDRICELWGSGLPIAIRVSPASRSCLLFGRSRQSEVDPTDGWTGVVAIGLWNGHGCVL
jgi:hypothetical protein